MLVFMLDRALPYNPEQPRLVLGSDHPRDSYVSGNNNWVLLMQSISWTWVKGWKPYMAILEKNLTNSLENFSLEWYSLPARFIFFLISRNDLTQLDPHKPLLLIYFFPEDTTAIIILQSFWFFKPPALLVLSDNLGCIVLNYFLSSRVGKT